MNGSSYGIAKAGALHRMRLSELQLSERQRWATVPDFVSLILMISHLRGTLLEKHPNQIVIDVHGVGYEVAIPVSVYSSLPDPGGPVRA